MKKTFLTCSVNTLLKATIISWTLLLIFSIGCKSTHKSAEPVSVKPDASSSTKTTGTVTHAYQASGCGTAVVITNSQSGAKTILLPINELGAFDVEGLEITFHFHPLKKMNPPGCKTGSPASLSDI
jgi:hypothetical protein